MYTILLLYFQLKQKEFELSTVRGEVDESSQQLKEQVKFARTVPIHDDHAMFVVFF